MRHPRVSLCLAALTAISAVVTPVSSVLAQDAPRPMPGAPGAPGAPGGPARTAPGEIRGRLTVVGGQPVTSGSITVQRGAQNAFAGGALPRPDGSFVVDGLQPGTYAVRVRVMGYAPVIRTDVVVSPARP